jgi:hypothetical protein
MTQEPEIALAEAISAVRRELNRAAVTPHDQQDIIGFRYGNVEIELEVELTREVEASAGVRFWVLSGDTQARGSVGNTNRVKITLLPYDRRTAGLPAGVLDNSEIPLVPTPGGAHQR